jgi:hypothetical protein
MNFQHNNWEHRRTPLHCLEVFELRFLITLWYPQTFLFNCVNISTFNLQISNSEHHKIRAKQQHVCKVMNQYMINTNRKWILSFGIEWTIGVKYRK